ncbi:MAG TPA: ABC transporter permease [Polaromonas sp.]|uniref:ABC transporter permease n=1 Tax=Polaromonas sp. UBA4122 TaxID=1947074 RepID=UPI000ED9FB4B|nr:ABC transporter permease [Polaromonas sp. UBA4122]HAL37761.1 ABC transporter permease [Polaromonas sp.]
MIGRIFHLLLKEFLELKRDKSARLRLLVPPVLQMLLFGYAATFEVFNVATVILDQDQTQESRALVADFVHSSRFKLVADATERRHVQDAVESSTAQLGIVVPQGFSELLRKGQSAPLQVLVDGTNSNTALIALGYVGQISGAFGQTYAQDLAQRTGRALGRPLVNVNLQERYWYNPNLNSRWFFVPGLIGTLTLITIVNLTAFAIVREREVGTLEQLLVTPIQPIEFIIGKTLPFFLIGLIEVSLVAMVGMLWFQVPFKGNPMVLLLGTCLFLFSVLAIGLLISTLCKTQQQAFASNFFVLNPMFILSGFSFPISSMPDALQWLTYLDPLRYFLIIIRGTYLKGVGIDVLWPQMAALAALGLGLFALAVLRFRKSLD